MHIINTHAKILREPGCVVMCNCIITQQTQFIMIETAIAITMPASMKKTTPHELDGAQLLPVRYLLNT